jgi:RecJ-like exonuclease
MKLFPVDCPICDATGKFPNEGECIQCQGEGKFNFEEELCDAILELEEYIERNPHHRKSKGRLRKLKDALESAQDKQSSFAAVWDGQPYDEEAASFINSLRGNTRVETNSCRNTINRALEERGLPFVVGLVKK